MSNLERLMALAIRQHVTCTYHGGPESDVPHAQYVLRLGVSGPSFRAPEAYGRTLEEAATAALDLLCMRAMDELAKGSEQASTDSAMVTPGSEPTDDQLVQRMGWCLEEKARGVLAPDHPQAGNQARVRGAADAYRDAASVVRALWSTRAVKTKGR